jgi:hypothetical protein
VVRGASVICLSVKRDLYGSVRLKLSPCPIVKLENLNWTQLGFDTDTGVVRTLLKARRAGIRQVGIPNMYVYIF